MVLYSHRDCAGHDPSSCRQFLALARHKWRVSGLLEPDPVFACQASCRVLIVLMSRRRVLVSTRVLAPCPCSLVACSCVESFRVLPLSSRHARHARRLPFQQRRGRALCNTHFFDFASCQETNRGILGLISGFRVRAFGHRGSGRHKDRCWRSIVLCHLQIMHKLGHRRLKKFCCICIVTCSSSICGMRPSLSNHAKLSSKTSPGKHNPNLHPLPQAQSLKYRPRQQRSPERTAAGRHGAWKAQRITEDQKTPLIRGVTEW